MSVCELSLCVMQRVCVRVCIEFVCHANGHRDRIIVIVSTYNAHLFVHTQHLLNITLGRSALFDENEGVDSYDEL